MRWLSARTAVCSFLTVSILVFVCAACSSKHQEAKSPEIVKTDNTLFGAWSGRSGGDESLPWLPAAYTITFKSNGHGSLMIAAGPISKFEWQTNSNQMVILETSKSEYTPDGIKQEEVNGERETLEFHWKDNILFLTPSNTGLIPLSCVRKE